MVLTKEESILRENSFNEKIGSSNPSNDSQSQQSKGDCCDILEEPNISDCLKIDIPEQPNISDDLNIDISEQVEPISTTFNLTEKFTTDKIFDSRDEVIAWCKDVGFKNNTVVVISKSDNKKTGKGSVVELGCERGGVYKAHLKQDHELKMDKKRKRQTGTKKCDCPFKLRSLCLEGNKWNLRVRSGKHNHFPTDTLTGHPYPGRLKDDEKDLLIKMTNSGSKPRQVMRAIKEKNPHNCSTMRTIYNAKAKIRMEDMDGRTKMQQLMHLLTEQHYVTWDKRDPESQELTDIFWANPESTLLAQCFPRVVLVDNTYKTNRFSMPLFHVVGMTSTGLSFTIAFAFMSGEKKENYVWALDHLRSLYSITSLPSVFITDNEQALINAIEIVFPGVHRLLCMWHIGRNVMTRLKKVIEKNKPLVEEMYNEWNALVTAESQVKYVEEYTHLASKWGRTYPELFDYIRGTWLEEKEHFVYAWTNEVKHYGNATNNRVESEHNIVKTYLGTSTGDFITCWKEIHNMLSNQIVKIKSSFERSLTSTLHQHNKPIFRLLRNHVSQYALVEINDELKRSDIGGMDEARCGCVIRKTLGLPCAHELVGYSRDLRPIPLSSVDSHWKQLSMVPIIEKKIDFDYSPILPLIKQRWIDSSEVERQAIFDKLKEIGTPKATNLQEPSKPFGPKGRPKLNKTKAEKKADKSTKRDPSEFEYYEESQSKPLVGPRNVSKTKSSSKKAQKPPKKIPVPPNPSEKVVEKVCLKTPNINVSVLDLNEPLPDLNEIIPILNEELVLTGEEQSTQQPKRKRMSFQLKDLTDEELLEQVLELFDPKIREYIIERLENVAPDGHCGYRCCAELLNMSKDDGWKNVRQCMLDELQNHRDLYMTQFGGEKTYNKVEKALNYFMSCCTKNYWMLFPEMGFLFATAFNCVLCVLSPDQYTTYLPLRIGPTDELKIISIVLYDDSHFLKAFLKSGAPIPKVVPGWDHLCYPDAHQWKIHLSAKIAEWDSLIGYPPIGLSSNQHMQFKMPVINV